MSSSMSDKALVEPNMTPILDMVFQLITFFMLVISFKSASLDLSLKLPVIGSARPLDMPPNEDPLILNVDARGRLNVYGAVQDVDTYIADEARAALVTAQKTNPKLKPGDELPTTVVIRADRATPFKLLNHVIAACQKNGFRRYSLKAMSTVEG